MDEVVQLLGREDELIERAEGDESKKREGGREREGYREKEAVRAERGRGMERERVSGEGRERKRR